MHYVQAYGIDGQLVYEGLIPSHMVDSLLDRFAANPAISVAIAERCTLH